MLDAAFVLRKASSPVIADPHLGGGCCVVTKSVRPEPGTQDKGPALPPLSSEARGQPPARSSSPSRAVGRQ